MANNVDRYLTEGDHSTVNHAGLPGVGGGGGDDTLPIGSIVPYGGPISGVPSGWLPCDGSVVAQATYPSLFSVIGTAWNIGGEPGGDFRLPDMRAKSPVGLNDGTLPAGTDGAFSVRALAALGGEEDHVLSVGELAAHSHSTVINMSDVVTNSPTTATDTTRVSAGNTPDLATALSGISSTGSNTPHNTMHPFAVVAYIIKAQQVGGGTGVSAQLSGGALEGPQPTVNYIPSGGAGVTVSDNPGQNRVDVTISAPAAEAFTSGIHGGTDHAGITNVNRCYAISFEETGSPPVAALEYPTRAAGGITSFVSPIAGRIINVGHICPTPGTYSINGTLTGNLSGTGATTITPVVIAAGGTIGVSVTVGGAVANMITLFIEP